MIQPEGLMHRKINVLAAFIVIIILAIISAWAIAAKAIFKSSAPGIGVNIQTFPIKCALDPPPAVGTCFNTCPVCGSLAGLCSGLFEVQAQFLSGTNVLYRSLAFCINPPTPPNGGNFAPGSQCLGNVWGQGPHLLQNFGCSFSGGFF